MLYFDGKFLVVTNGFNKLYRLEMSYDFFQNHRDKVGIQGTWTAYFELLKKALPGTTLTSLENGEKLHLNFYYPLMEGARIHGVIVLIDEGIDTELTDMSRHVLI